MGAGIFVFSALVKAAASLTRLTAGPEPLTPKEARPLLPLLRWLARRPEALLDDALDGFGTATWLAAVRFGVVEEVDHYDLEAWGRFGRITAKGRRTLEAYRRPQPAD